MNFMLAVLLLCSLCATAFIPYQNGKIRRRFTERNVATTPEKDERAADGQWWHDGVDFGCTACGKCCVNDGEVWFDMDEFYELSEYLNMSYTDVLDDYAEEVKSGWVKLKDKKETSTGHGCVFLGDDDKTCGVYSARPIQCRTYPYWPRLLTSEDAWKKEAVVTDDKAGKHWSAANGGCEGMH
jgi:Fe-S-cluster containining protein